MTLRVMIYSALPFSIPKNGLSFIAIPRSSVFKLEF